MSTEDDMWQDYDYYMHTGELSEYFEEDDCVEEYESNNTESLNLEDLDDIIRHLKQLKKENERIIREEKKNEKAQKKSAVQKNKTSKTNISSTKQKKSNKSHTNNNSILIGILITFVVLWILVLIIFS